MTGIYDSGEVERRSLWGGIERSTRLRIERRGGRWGRRGGCIWLLSPHPQSVSQYEVDLGRKGTKPWDEEITTHTPIKREIHFWRSARGGGVAHGLWFFFFLLLKGVLFFLPLARSVWSVGGKEYKRTGNNRSTFYSQVTPLCCCSGKVEYSGSLSTVWDEKELLFWGKNTDFKSCPPVNQL